MSGEEGKEVLDEEGEPACVDVEELEHGVAVDATEGALGLDGSVVEESGAVENEPRRYPGLGKPGGEGLRARRVGHVESVPSDLRV